MLIEIILKVTTDDVTAALNALAQDNKPEVLKILKSLNEFLTKELEKLP